MVFAQKLRTLRECQGLTQKQMAEIVKVSLRAYQGYESGRYPRNQHIMQRIAAFFSVSIDELLSDEDNFVYSAQDKYGSRGALQAKKVLAAVEALYAGGTLNDEDEAAFQAHIMQIFDRAKESNMVRRSSHDSHTEGGN